MFTYVQTIKQQLSRILSTIAGLLGWLKDLPTKGTKSHSPTLIGGASTQQPSTATQQDISMLVTLSLFAIAIIMWPLVRLITSLIISALAEAGKKIMAPHRAITIGKAL